MSATARVCERQPISGRDRVNLLDHIVVGADAVFSFAESGELAEIELAAMAG